VSTGGDLGDLMHVALEVTAELGRCTMRLREVLELGTGAIVSLERSAGSPVDLLVNDELIARGDLVAVDDRYGVRITEVLAPSRHPP
jgi:flagellar motor switch protein FliN/FliY